MWVIKVDGINTKLALMHCSKLMLPFKTLSRLRDSKIKIPPIGKTMMSQKIKAR